MSAAAPRPVATSPARSPQRWRGAALAALPLLATAIFYYPITDNYFFGDDLLNLYRIVDWGFWRYVLTPYAGHVLVLRNAIYCACFQLFGPEPRFFFVLVLLTHLLNVFLLFRVVITFTGSARLACIGAALWGISPINEGTIGWYSVYGQALVGTISLWLLVRLGRVAQGDTVSHRELAAWVLLVFATSTLFGTGTGVAMAIPVAAFFVLPSSVPRLRLLGGLIVAAVAVPVLYYGLHVLANRLQWGMRTASPFRLLPFWSVLSELFIGLLERGAESLFLGRADVAWSIFPALPVVLLLVATLLLGAALGGGAVRRRLLAVLVLAASGYFMIALGRGPMVARGMQAESVLGAARYHYLGPMFIAVALCVALDAIGRRWRAPAGARDALLAACLVAAIGVRVLAAPKIDSHEWARLRTAEALRRLGEVLGAAPAGSDVYIRFPDEPFNGIGPLLVGKPHLFPGVAGVFAVFFPDNVVGGKRVFFVTGNPKILRSSVGGRRSATLFVAPEDVPKGQSLVDL